MEDSSETLGFSEYAARVLTFAKEEADRLNHNFIGTEHLLLGISKLGTGVVINVLGEYGATSQRILEEVERNIGEGPDQKMIGNVPLTPRSKKIIFLARKEARRLLGKQVEPEHILLGILNEADCVAAKILAGSFKVETDEARMKIVSEQRRLGDLHRMKDFEKKLREPLERVLCNFGDNAELRITKIVDRWPFTANETAARNCKTPHNVFHERFKGQTFYAVEIIYSPEYLEKYNTKVDWHLLPCVCATVFITLGLGSLVVGKAEDYYDRICFPVPFTAEVYNHLPPLDEA